MQGSAPAVGSNPGRRETPRHGRTEKAAVGVAIVIVLVVSVVLTVRRGDAGAARAEPKRFSGSMVVLPMRPLLPVPRLERAVRVAVVRDEAAASFYNSAATLDSTVEAWRATLTNVGADVRVVRSAELRAMTDWASVLVVPSSPCLTVATREAMEAASSRGQGLIVAGATGALDAACRQIGYGLVVALTTASRVEPLESRSMVYVTMIAGSPLTDDMPPGARLDLKPAGQLALRHPARDAYYSDYELQPAPAGNQPLLDGALSHGFYGKARVVYWGFELRDAVARPWNEAVLSVLVRNSVRWAAGLPSAMIEPWPDGRRAAAVLAQDVEDHFANARYALDSLRAADVRGTFFLTSDLALRNPRLAARLNDEGEVGTHSENHRLLGGTPADAQRQRLAKSQHDLTAMFGNGVRGLRPPQEQFDAATMTGWLAAGGTYLLGANDSRTVGPELLPVGADTLVLLSRNGGDDFTAVREGRRDPGATAAIFLRDYARIKALGGLYILSYHSQLLSTPELVPALARVAREVSTDTLIWPATAGAVARWWRSRAELDVRLRPRGTGGLDIVVQNRGAELVLGAVAQVRLESPRRVLRTSTAQLTSEPGIVRVRLPPLQPRETRVVNVTFATPAAARPRSRATTATRHRKYARPRADARPPWWAPWRW
jgi:peptidoglycan/xylan/chitin deacetylase (PgdA/CDA1 family)